jgi:hypothetical protein
MVSAGGVREIEVTNEDLGNFISACTSIVEKQEKKMIPSALRALGVGGSEESIHFRLFQIGDWSLGAFLERYDADLLAPGDMLGAVQAHKASQRVDCSQALIPRRNGATPAVLKIKKE